MRYSATHGHKQDDSNGFWTDNQPDILAPAIAPSGRPTVPAGSQTSITQTLYLTENGDTSAVSYNDIHQGALGDCYLLAAIGEIAMFHPATITSMIRSVTATTEAVTLYRDASGALPGFGSTSFKACTALVTNSLFSSRGVNSVASYSQNIVGKQQEIWPQVLENAEAILHGGYGNIAQGGYPVLAMEELTGMPASAITPGKLTIASLVSHIAAGDLMVFDTANSNSLPYGLIGNHAYMFKSFDQGTGQIQLANPWGVNQPAPIAFASLQQAGIVEIDIGHVRA